MLLLRHPPVCVSLVCLLAASVAHAGTIRHDRDPQQYLDLGAAAEYASVGRFDVTKWEPGFSASGTLVDDNWVLTAAHPLDGATSAQFTVGGRTYGISKWVQHPEWRGVYRDGYDLALVKLDAAVTEVAPARLYGGRGERKKVATFVGFGRTGNGISGHAEYDALKRAGQNTIDGSLAPAGPASDPTYRNRLTRGARSFLVDFDNPDEAADSTTGRPEPLDLEYLISLGDSGGGAFIGKGKRTRLAGVHSFAELPDGVDDSDYGDITGHVRVSSYVKWIRGTIKLDDKAEAQALKQALREGGDAGRELSSEWTTLSTAVVPEPSLLAGLALAVMTLRRPARL